MLGRAVRAGVPLMTARIPDIQHAAILVHAAAGRIPLWLGSSLKTKQLYLVKWNEDIGEPWEDALAVDSQVIVLNPEAPVPGAFDVGEVRPSESLVAEHLALHLHGVSPARARALAPALRGLTLAEAHQCVLLASTEGALTPDAVTATRKECFARATGLRLVGTTLEHYQRVDRLEAWLALNRRYFLEAGHDARLVPRGLLFHGPPGTGKTLGAKRAAQAWGVPLYRLDVGSIKHRYVGDSERNFRTALRDLDAEEPCVVLVDEVEKLFEAGDDAGVTSGILAELLWWMQERASRVLVVMTTNALEKLPPELVRGGRVDAHVEFPLLGGARLVRFGKAYAKTLGVSWRGARGRLHLGRQQFSHAEVAAACVEERKHRDAEEEER